MKEIQVFQDQQRITSLEIATVIDKPHNDLLKAIRKMEPAWEREHKGKFSQMQIQERLPNGGYRMRPCYMLTKTESLYVATKFNDVARARLVIRWEELEKTHVNQQQVLMHEVKLLETEQEVKQRCDNLRRKEICQMNAVADGCLTMSEIAKMLDTTVKVLNKMLVEQGVQYYNGGRYKLTPEYEELGLAKDRVFHYYSLDGEKKQRYYLVWTPEGVRFIEALSIKH